MSPRHVALVPAAGVGVRFGAGLPKQYSLLLGQTVLHHTLAMLQAELNIDQVVVVIAPDDPYFDQYEWPFTKLTVLRCGGASRAQTVQQGLAELLQQGPLQDQDWVLVHDAARCCLSAAALSQLIGHLHGHPIGGLLALPVADTLKRATADGDVAATVERAGLWQAQTPQMFRARLLADALALGDLNHVTDEASAIEALGLQPKLVLGEASNFKLTLQQDRLLAEAVLSSRRAQQEGTL
ncbi:MAG: 2-C-methyl-D-erythritol 4-phosphate cytidylyltransferase [Neisseriaceae bacterium]|nr:2-C-methyl-D-erythritol 4-phosphate cytidylyltransferase [Neisseriaceae bacterium]